MRPSADGVERRDQVRALLAARHIYAGGAVDTRWLRKVFGISDSTARRDLRFIRLYLPVSVRLCREGRGKPLRRVKLREGEERDE